MLQNHTECTLAFQAPFIYQSMHTLYKYVVLKKSMKILQKKLKKEISFEAKLTTYSTCKKNQQHRNLSYSNKPQSIRWQNQQW